MSASLFLVPLDRREAHAFINKHHRHHRAPVGEVFCLGAVDRDGRLRGAATVGRPVARGLQDGWTLEVTRVATDGTKDACSFLYGACRRAAFALGFRRLVTYTLQREAGSSLRAAGWKVVGEVKGRSWSCPSRPRFDPPALEDKFRWEVEQVSKESQAEGVVQVESMSDRLSWGRW
jgi:hypothetical protein